jgi:hypothetical protein
MDWNRRGFVRVLGSVLLGYTAFLGACTRSGGETRSKEEKRPPHSPAAIASGPPKSPPPIDVAMPGRVETATFALG